MEMFKWLPGRQAGCIYHKFCFLYVKVGKWGFDGYLLRYPEDAHLPPHKDPIPGGKMWRLNLTLKGKALFESEKEILRIGQFLHLFRADKYVHQLYALTKVCKLSIGIAKFG